MSRKREFSQFTAGILVGITLLPTAHATAQYFTATPGTRTIYLEEQKLESYTIQGQDFIPLDSLKGLLRVTYQPNSNTVRISENEQKVIRYIPKAGDVIRCNDGTDYTIIDVSRWDKNAFSNGPLGDLPTPPPSSLNRSCPRSKQDIL